MFADKKDTSMRLANLEKNVKEIYVIILDEKHF